MATSFSDLDHKAAEEQLASARARFEVERVVATTITEDPPEVITVPGDLDQRVVKGVEWLDENIPNWASRIDVERFSIRHAGRCILGQLESEYSDGVAKWFGRDEQFHLRNDLACEHGFLWKDWKQIQAGGEDASVLNDSWVRAIKFRQAHP